MRRNFDGLTFWRISLVLVNVPRAVGKYVLYFGTQQLVCVSLESQLFGMHYIISSFTEIILTFNLCKNIDFTITK